MPKTPLSPVFNPKTRRGSVTFTGSQSGIPASPLTVTINQAAGQADPTSHSPILFDVVFSEPVTGFTGADVVLSGSAGATFAAVSGSGANYTVSVPTFTYVDTWTLHNTTPDNEFGFQGHWRCLTWATELGLWVVGSGPQGTGGGPVTPNRVMTSPDGINWTLRSNGVELVDICWSPELGLLVGVELGPGATAVTSPDGINWTSHSTLISCTSVVWAPELGKFVGLGLSAGVVTSPDGVTWTLHSVPSPNVGWAEICWSPELGLLLAVSNASGYTGMTSSDGINWTNHPTPMPARDVCWADTLGLFVAVNTSAPDHVMTSPDAINWTIRAIPDVNDMSWNNVCWAHQLGRLMIISLGDVNGEGDPAPAAMTSTDGINWTLQDTPTTYFPGVVSDVGWEALGYSPNLNQFLATGRIFDDAGDSPVRTQP